MAGFLYTDGKFQGIDNDGLVVALGTLKFTHSDTGLDAITYQDSALSIANTNPINLTSSGKANIFLANSVYDVVLKKADEVVVWSKEDYEVFEIDEITLEDFLAIKSDKTVTPHVVDVYSDLEGLDTSVFTAAVIKASGSTWIYKNDVWSPEKGIVSVVDFGAIGDGVTDDTIPLQTAQSVNARNIDFGDDKHYLISGELPIHYDNMTFQGFSKIEMTANNTKMFSGTGLDTVKFIGLELIGKGATDTASTVNGSNGSVNAQGYGIEFDQGTNLQVLWCKIKGFKNDGIRASYSSNVRIFDNEIEGTYPDTDIPDGDTAHQQFGINIYAQTDAEAGATIAEVVAGTAFRHNSKNIFIERNTVTQTAIGICVFPGFSNVSIIDNKTFGSLAQHSIYIYPKEGLRIAHNQLEASQYVGVKLSCNVQAQLYAPSKLDISHNTIRNTKAPAISLEMYDKNLDGDSDANKASVFFRDVNIADNFITDTADSAMIIGCAIDCTVHNNKMRNIRPSSARTAIDCRGSQLNLFNNTVKSSSYGALGGSFLTRYSMKLGDNEFTDCCGSTTAPYVSGLAQQTPFAFTTNRTHNWYADGALIYNETTTECYFVAGTGIAGDTAPTGMNSVISGDIIFRYIGLYADLKTEITFDSNSFLIEGGTLATNCVVLNDSSFRYKLRNNFAEEGISSAQFVGIFLEDCSNNFRNIARAERVINANAKGQGRSEYFGSSAPASGSFQQSDTMWNSNPIAGGITGWICVSAGSPGIWKSFGNIGS